MGSLWTKEGKLECRADDIHPLAWHTGLGLAFWVIIVLIIIMYVRIYNVIMKSMRKRSIQDGGLGSNQNTNSYKTTKMILITVGVFIVCWTPEVILVHLLVEKKIGMLPVYFSYLLSYSSSAMNFFIYAATSPKYRTAFRVLCCSLR